MHEQRLEVARSEVLDAAAQSGVDPDCADGDLLVRLATEPDFSRLVGIDICAESLERLCAD